MTCMWENRNAYWVLVGKPEGKRPRGKLRRRWNYIKMTLKRVALYGLVLSG